MNLITLKEHLIALLEICVQYFHDIVNLWSTKTFLQQVGRQIIILTKQFRCDGLLEQLRVLYF